jgi:DNA-directed RNA polymerase beta subunit
MSQIINNRVNFATVKNPVPYPDFLDVQLKSFRDFLQLDTPPEKRKKDGLYKVFAENFPIADTRNNFVLEFDNKRDDNGNVIRSPKTLKRIYHINKERKITVATGKPTGNEGVDYGTSLMTYYLVTDVVMPEFPDYFTDVG